ncbi:hypothetical protein KIN20_000218 [Parelaphostrongylus tenuis]|uniref:Uncharacterized protein n=1 Tax=Parelaphostrongylus tenuis TaxID=148309 RepID=A0AAD5QFV6_PARTN|nr:hypothetical protein KIN20_000218 [Parelaphostrongylus tenuis]
MPIPGVSASDEHSRNGLLSINYNVCRGAEKDNLKEVTLDIQVRAAQSGKKSVSK